jgi:16S rRNA (adenine1518-N6/adenine1519-N6)-dimethyltransferase
MKHIPRKRFGQNFLKDASVLDNIIRVIHPAMEDRMVEIGPGLGAMTQLLLPSLSRLDVIEVDRDLVARLRKSFDPNRLVVHECDALAFDFSQLLPDSPGKLRIVGNLPYNISSPLLFHLTQFSRQVQDQHFMLQKEVVERMVAEPGSKVYGRLSVMLQWLYHMELLFVVPPTAFDPPPKVDSAIVRMIPLPAPLACDPSVLEQVVAKAFAQRRKVLRNCLSGMFTENELIDAGVDPQARPETIPMEQFVMLANRMKQH